MSSYFVYGRSWVLVLGLSVLCSALLPVVGTFAQEDESGSYQDELYRQLLEKQAQEASQETYSDGSPANEALSTVSAEPTECTPSKSLPPSKLAPPKNSNGLWDLGVRWRRFAISDAPENAGYKNDGHFKLWVAYTGTFSKNLKWQGDLWRERKRLREQIPAGWAECRNVWDLEQSLAHVEAELEAQLDSNERLLAEINKKWSELGNSGRLSRVGDAYVAQAEGLMRETQQSLYQ